MLARLPEFESGRLLAAVAHTQEVADKYLKRGQRVLLLQGGEGRLIPGGFSFDLASCENPEKLAGLCDYDVVEVDEGGFIRTFYRNSTPDNAIVPTGKCNSNCLMCPSSDYARRMASVESLDYLLELVSYFPEDAPHITVTGGEPFLMGRGIFKLFECMRDHFTCTEFLTLTNGRALSLRSFRDELERTIPRGMQFGIPIHGSSAETHDAVTRATGSFEQTVAGVKGLLSRRVGVELRIVVSRLNMHDVDAIAELVTREMPGVSSVKIIGLEMLGNAWRNRERVWITYDEAFEASRNAIARLMEAGVDVRLYNFPLCAVPREYWHICAKSITDYKVRFPAECEGCAVADACCGLFAGSYRHAKSHIRPVMEG